MAPLQITVYPKDNMTPAPPSGQGGGDPYAAYDDAPPAPPQQQATDPYAAYDDAPPPKKASREIGAPESFGIGAREGVTFGGFPALHGLISAGQTKEEREASEKKYASGETPSAASELGDLFRGLFKVGHEHLIEPALGEASKTYREERDRAREEQESAEAQNPKSYIGGQLASAVAVPLGGAGIASKAAGPIERAFVGGAVGGGLYGLGGGISAGDDPAQLATDTGLGAVTGGAVGGLGGAAVEGVGRLAKRAKNIIQGAINPEAVAQRNVGGAIRDAREAGQLGIDVPTYAAAQSSGMPVHNVDIGGSRTRDMARGLSNLSPEAADILEPAMAERIEGRPQRIVDTVSRLFGARGGDVAIEPQAARFGRLIRGTTGGADAAADVARLREAARRANRPAYQRAYSAGDREIWSPELERLTSAPSIKQAMQAAVNKWKDWQVVDGFGGVNPGATVGNGGILTIRGGQTGVPAFPNIQFWDYTARNIADKAEAARRAGRNQLAAQLGGLERQIKTELDRLVPEYQEARRGAAQFFGAEDALDAGRAFARSSANIGEARQALAAMSAPERELFARGYASEKADLIERNAPGGNLLDSAALASPAERQKMEMALGPQRMAALDREIAPDRLYHVFDGATSAAEAGRNFVGAEIPRNTVMQALSRMTPQDRDLFTRNFGDALGRAVLKNGSWNTINRAFTAPLAREKIEAVLGAGRAKELEIVLRAEMIGRKTEQALLGNSTTQRQGATMARLAKQGLAVGGHGAVGALGTFELLKEGDYSGKDIIVGALILGSLRGGAHHIDMKVARKMAELLTSEDPATVRRGAQAIARSPQLFQALRRGTEAGARVTARDLGPSGVGAGLAAAYEHVMADGEGDHHGHDNQSVFSEPAQQ